jgi:hypothetical protein
MTENTSVQETRLDTALIRVARRVIDPVFLGTPLYRCEALEPVFGQVRPLQRSAELAVRGPD